MNKKRYNSEGLQPSVKHSGGSVMVWGISAIGAVDVVNTDGNMNTEKYSQSLIQNVISTHALAYVHLHM